MSRQHSDPFRPCSGIFRRGWPAAAVAMLLALSPVVQAQTDPPACSAVFPQAITENAPAADQLDLPPFPAGMSGFTGGTLTLPNATYCPNGTDCYFTSMTGQVNVTMTSPVRIFVEGDMNLNNDSSFNDGGDPGDALVFVYGDFRLSNDSVFNGIAYSQGSMQLQPRTSVSGALTAEGSVQLSGGGPNTPTVQYDADAVNTADFGDLCVNEATVTVDHYRLIHPADGLTCQAAAVTLRACLDADCVNLQEDAVTVELSPAGGWQGGAVRAFAGGEESLLFRRTTAGIANLAISSADPTAPLRCFNPASTTETACSIVFADAGFILRRPDGAIRPAGVAGEVVNATLQAVRSDDTAQACIAHQGFANETRPLALDFSYQSPGSGTRIPGINGVALPDTVDLDFDANALAAVDILYGDAGVIELDALYTGSVTTGDDGLVMPLVGERGVGFRPDHLLVSAERTDGSVLDNDTTSGAPTHPAGAAFRMIVQARDAAGNTLPNFRHNPVTLGSRFHEPAAGSGFEDGVLGVPGVDMTTGTFQIDTQTISEAGVFRFQAEAVDYLPDYFPANAIAPVYGQPHGRFIPHHFAVVDSSVDNRRDAACSPASVFTYMGEPLDLRLTMEARNLAGNVVLNHRDPFSSAIALGLAAVDDPDGDAVVLTDRLNVSASNGDWALGVLDRVVTLSLERDGRPDGPYPSLTPGIAPTDADGVTLLPSGLDMDADGDGTDDTAALAGTAVLYGRLALGNAHGSELVDLALPVRAEYFDGTGFLVNADDSCTPLAWGSELVEGETVLDNGGSLPAPTLQGLTTDGRLDQGRAGLVYACGSGTCDTGYTRVCGDLTVDLPWLRYPWNPQDTLCGPLTGDTNPVGRATFGVYSGSERIIYLRERLD